MWFDVKNLQWTPELLIQVKELYGKITASEIAEKLGLKSKYTVYNIASKALNIQASKGSIEHRIRLSEMNKRAYKNSPKMQKTTRENLLKGHLKTPERRAKISKGVKKHHEKVETLEKELIAQGYQVFPVSKIIPDLIALKDGKLYAFEVHRGRVRPNWARYKDYPFIELKIV